MAISTNHMPIIWVSLFENFRSTKSNYIKLCDTMCKSILWFTVNRWRFSCYCSFTYIWQCNTQTSLFPEESKRNETGRYQHSNCPVNTKHLYNIIQRQSNVFYVDPTLYKWYTNVLCLLGDLVFFPPISAIGVQWAHFCLLSLDSVQWILTKACFAVWTMFYD